MSSATNSPSVPEPAAQATEASPGYYVPGYVKSKIVMFVLGLGITAIAGRELYTPLSLLFFGTSATAEATRVIKTKPGMPDEILTDDHQIQKEHEPRDRSYLFINEFRLHTSDGREVDVQVPIHAQLKPLFTLRDPDGLPSSVWVRYDAADPKRVCFPSLIGTWFMPGGLFVMGLIASLIGGVLLKNARKPLELPRITPEASAAPAATPAPATTAAPQAKS